MRIMFRCHCTLLLHTALFVSNGYARGDLEKRPDGGAPNAIPHESEARSDDSPPKTSEKPDTTRKVQTPQEEEKVPEATELFSGEITWQTDYSEKHWGFNLDQLAVMADLLLRKDRDELHQQFPIKSAVEGCVAAFEEVETEVEMEMGEEMAMGKEIDIVAKEIVENEVVVRERIEGKEAETRTSSQAVLPHKGLHKLNPAYVTILESAISKAEEDRLQFLNAAEAVELMFGMLTILFDAVGAGGETGASPRREQGKGEEGDNRKGEGAEKTQGEGRKTGSKSGTSIQVGAGGPVRMRAKNVLNESKVPTLLAEVEARRSQAYYKGTALTSVRGTVLGPVLLIISSHLPAIHFFRNHMQVQTNVSFFAGLIYHIEKTPTVVKITETARALKESHLVGLEVFKLILERFGEVGEGFSENEKGTSEESQERKKTDIQRSQGAEKRTDLNSDDHGRGDTFRNNMLHERKVKWLRAANRVATTKTEKKRNGPGNKKVKFNDNGLILKDKQIENSTAPEGAEALSLIKEKVKRLVNDVQKDREKDGQQDGENGAQNDLQMTSSGSKTTGNRLKSRLSSNTVPDALFILLHHVQQKAVDEAEKIQSENELRRLALRIGRMGKEEIRGEILRRKRSKTTTAQNLTGEHKTETTGEHQTDHGEDNRKDNHPITILDYSVASVNLTHTAPLADKFGASAGVIQLKNYLMLLQFEFQSSEIGTASFNERTPRSASLRIGDVLELNFSDRYESDVKHVQTLPNSGEKTRPAAHIVCGQKNVETGICVWYLLENGARLGLAPVGEVFDKEHDWDLKSGNHNDKCEYSDETWVTAPTTGERHCIQTKYEIEKARWVRLNPKKDIPQTNTMWQCRGGMHGDYRTFVNKIQELATEKSHKTIMSPEAPGDTSDSKKANSGDISDANLPTSDSIKAKLDELFPPAGFLQFSSDSTPMPVLVKNGLEVLRRQLKESDGLVRDLGDASGLRWDRWDPQSAQKISEKPAITEITSFLLFFDSKKKAPESSAGNTTREDNTVNTSSAKDWVGATNFWFGEIRVRAKAADIDVNGAYNLSEVVDPTQPEPEGEGKYGNNVLPDSSKFGSGNGTSNALAPRMPSTTEFSQTVFCLLEEENSRNLDYAIQSTQKTEKHSNADHNNNIDDAESFDKSIDKSIDKNIDDNRNARPPHGVIGNHPPIHDQSWLWLLISVGICGISFFILLSGYKIAGGWDWCGGSCGKICGVMWEGVWVLVCKISIIICCGGCGGGPGGGKVEDANDVMSDDGSVTSLGDFGSSDSEEDVDVLRDINGNGVGNRESNDSQSATTPSVQRPNTATGENAVSSRGLGEEGSKNPSRKVAPSVAPADDEDLALSQKLYAILQTQERQIERLLTGGNTRQDNSPHNDSGRSDALTHDQEKDTNSTGSGGAECGSGQKPQKGEGDDLSAASNTIDSELGVPDASVTPNENRTAEAGTETPVGLVSANAGGDSNSSSTRAAQADDQKSTAIQESLKQYREKAALILQEAVESRARVARERREATERSKQAERENVRKATLQAGGDGNENDIGDNSHCAGIADICDGGSDGVCISAFTSQAEGENTTSNSTCNSTRNSTSNSTSNSTRNSKTSSPSTIDDNPTHRSQTSNLPSCRRFPRIPTLSIPPQLPTLSMYDLHEFRELRIPTLFSSDISESYRRPGESSQPGASGLQAVDSTQAVGGSRKSPSGSDGQARGSGAGTTGAEVSSRRMSDGNARSPNSNMAAANSNTTTSTSSNTAVTNTAASNTRPPNTEPLNDNLTRTAQTQVSMTSYQYPPSVEGYGYRER